MTANASLQPADEKRQPPLGEEELAKMERVYDQSEDWRWVHGHAGLQRPLIRRLIAALRAKDEELQRLRRCAVWALWHIEEEWANGPTGDDENWKRFQAVVNRNEGEPPELWMLDPLA